MQKVRRKLRHVQSRPLEVEAAPQDPVFTQGQLLRSIGAALAIVGFDSATPSALEMFRGCVEECEKDSGQKIPGKRCETDQRDQTFSLSSTKPQLRCLLAGAQLRQLKTS